MPKTANLFNIQHFSINDGSGIRTVVFFKGCPLDCAWCHNPESKSSKQELSFLNTKCVRCGRCAAVCPRGVHVFTDGQHHINRQKCIDCGKCADECVFSALEVVGKEMTLDEIMEEIEKDAVFFEGGGGVTFSGGEPFLQFEALYELLKMCAQRGYSVCIETSGFTTRKNIAKAAEYIDYFLYDFKETNAENHKKYTGTDQKIIINNLAALNDLGGAVILRCPIIPGVNDREEHFRQLARLADQYSCIKAMEMMLYHPLGISKSKQIGKPCRYENPSFLKKELIADYVEMMRKITQKPVTVSGD